MNQGRVALVTGASSGIGRCLAIELARQGDDLILVARREQELNALADEIRALDRKADVVVGDISDQSVRSQALELAQEVFGGLDILVNNAGISAHGKFADASPERLRQIMEVNFFAAAELAREAIPLLSNGRDPIIVNVGSILGHRGIPFNSEYCASKFALRGLSESLRTELAPLGIHVLLVSPGTTDTEFFDHLIDKQGELPWASPQGVAADSVARATVRAIERRRNEIVPSNRGRLLVWLNRLSPRLVDWMMGRYTRKK